MKEACLEIRRLTGKGGAQIVDAVLTEPSTWEDVSDDGSMSRTDFTVEGLIDDERHWYLAAIHEGRVAALATIHPMNAVTGQVHIVITPEARGAVGIEACRALARHAVRHVPFEAYMAFTHARHAAILAARVGFKRMGLLRRSFLKNGVYQDQTVWQMEKGD